MSQNHEVEERLFVDRHGRHKLNEVFWCHMGRYAHARQLARARSHALGRPLRVLDAACGTGYGSFFLSRAGHFCTGLDLDEEAVAYCRRTYGRPRCRFRQGSVTELPFENQSFDLVVSFETIEHLSHEQQSTFLDEIARVLRPGGALTLSAPVQQGGLDSPTHNEFHQHEPDPLQLIDALQSRFEQVQTFGQLVNSHTRGDSGDSAETQGNSEVGEDIAAPPSRLRRVRGGVRGAADALFHRHYLMRPALLQGVMAALYGGYAIVPLDWQRQNATFLIADARAQTEPQT